MKIGNLKIRKKIKKLCFGLFAAASFILGVGTTQIQAATYPSEWQLGDLQRNGAYYERMEWRFLNMTETGATIEILDTAWTDPSRTNYWVGHIAVFVDGVYTSTVYAPTDLHPFYGIESIRGTFQVKGYGNHYIECKPQLFNGNVQVATNSAFWIHIPKPKHTNKIDHWMFGFKNGEGTNGPKDAWQMGTTNAGTVTLGDSFTLNSGHAMKIPNGYSLSKTFGSNSVDGKWHTYPMPSTFTQKNASMHFEYDYMPNNYKIAYNVNGGNPLNNPPTSYNVLYGPKLPTPSRKGYTFDGWIDSKSNKKVNSFNYNRNNRFSSTTAMYSELNNRDTGNRTVTAQWIPKQYKVTYEGNGGTWNGKTSWHNWATYDSNYVTEKNFYDKKGYEFVGWNTKPDGSGDDWTKWIGKSQKWTYDHGVTLYAQWKPIQYKIVYNGNGHTSGSMKDQPMTYDKSATLHKNTYKKDKADWIGWNTKADGTGKKFQDQQEVKNLTSKKNGTVVLYAQWDHVPVLDTKDDAVKKGQSVTVGQILDNNAKAQDKEDGPLNSSIKVEKIEYPDGTIVQRPGRGESIDTNWGNNKKVTITVTVEDSFGHKVTNKIVITVIGGDQDEDVTPPAPPINQNKPKLYNRYIHKGYQWSLDSDSVWTQNPEYRDELNEVLNNLQ